MGLNRPTMLCQNRAILLLILAVSFPYLPGAQSPVVVRGFSLFVVGASSRFSSSGLIAKPLLAGIPLTYSTGVQVRLTWIRIEGVVREDHRRRHSSLPG